MADVDMDKLHQFIGRMLGDLGGAASVALVHIGDQLGLYKTLHAKGLTQMTVLRHAVRNAMPQVLAVMGLQFGYLVGGSILIETIFTWPGTGFLMNKAILTRDIPLLQGSMLILALCFVAINLAVDLLQSTIDPRIKRG